MNYYMRPEYAKRMTRDMQMDFWILIRSMEPKNGNPVDTKIYNSYLDKYYTTERPEGGRIFAEDTP